MRLQSSALAAYTSFQFDKKGPTISCGAQLPDLDSNQDKQSQSLSYYRYTIRQFAGKELISFIFGCKDNLDTWKDEG